MAVQAELTKTERHKKSIEAIRAKYLEQVSGGKKTFNNRETTALLSALKDELARKERLIPMAQKMQGGIACFTKTKSN